ncbi:MAG: cell division protein FtsQ [Prevotella sp.]|nr:cell division protein FtsQ [Prevotella sp.]
MSFNWKKSLLIAFDIVIAAYLVLAISAFNEPAEKATVCSEVKIDIDNGISEGFLDNAQVKLLLQRNKLYPLAKPMEDISARNIEETLRKNPFVESAECYKTQTGHVCIQLKQRMPVVHVMANSGDNYYVDTHGSVLPETRYASDMVIATGWITHKYAKNQLLQVANIILNDKFWHNQTEQLNVLFDGSMELVPRVGDHIVYLGQPVDVEKKLERLRKFYLYGLNQAGWNKYSHISVEFDNQIICKKRKR